MDCQMPDLDGFDATLRIRRDAELNKTNIPIIALTADAMPGTRERCLEVGMNDYVAKPVQMNQLTALLSKWLPRKEPVNEAS